MKRLETERLILRSWTMDDLDDFYAYSKNPNVGPNAGWPAHKNPQESETILRRFIEQDNVWALELKAQPGVIGSFGVHRDTKRDGLDTRMIGYVLAQEHWGRGLMTEAVRRVLEYLFIEQRVEMVSAYHYPFNERSRRVIEKCGFHFEGCLRRATQLPDGSYCDDMCYSLLRSEYLGLE